MTTSSDQKKPTPPLRGDHWEELTATLTPEMTEEFSIWLGQELETLEAELESYVTPDSLRKSLRR